MEKDPAIWSRTFARKLGALLGLAAPEAVPGETALQKKVETLLEEMTEDFRYLAGEQWNWAEHLTRFLLERCIGRRQIGSDHAALTQRLETLRVVRSYVAFLRSCHGLALPADESDEWSDEDWRDFQLATWQRLDKEDPYPWPEAPSDAHTG